MKRLLIIISLLCVLSFCGFAQQFDFIADTTQGCSPLKVVFINKTEQIQDYTYEWTVEQGKFSTQQDSVQNTYIKSGSYTVTMTAYDKTKTKVATVKKENYITVFNDPDVVITSDKNESCEDSDFQFSITSIQSDTTIVSYTWILSDGTIYQTQNPPAHMFGFADDFTIFLSVQDANGCTNRERKSITVKTYDDYPNLSFSLSQSRACEPQLNVNFTNTTTDNSISVFHWDYGDGNTHEGKNPPAHTYNGYGNYYAKLSANSEHGCVGTTLRSIQLINFQPNITINDEYPAIQFVNSLHNYNQSISKNGFPSQTKSTKTDKTVFCPGNITFSDASNTTNLSWAWDLNNDGTIESTDKIFKTEILEPGNYTIKLTTSNGVCTKDIVKDFSIEQNLELTVTPKNAFFCHSPADVTYSVESNIPGTTFLWEINDTLYTKNQFIKTQHEGIYSTNVYAISPNYCTASVNLPNNVEIATPHMYVTKGETYASPRSGCAPLDVTFSVYYKYKTTQDSVKNIKWDYQNDNIYEDTDSFLERAETGTATQHWTYENEGLYAYTIRLETYKGCAIRNYTLQEKDSISVGREPNLSFDYIKEICANEPLQVAVSYNGEDKRYTSQFDTLSLIFTEINGLNFYTTVSIETPIPAVAEVTFSDTVGSHIPSFIVSDNGCSKTYDILDAVEVKGPMVFILSSPTSCSHPFDYDYTFRKNYSSNSWKWYIRKQESTIWENIPDSDNKDSIHIDYTQYGGRGYYLVMATAENPETGCTMSDSITTHVTNVTGNFYLGKNEPCRGDTAQFILSQEDNQDVVSWTWVYKWNGVEKSYKFAELEEEGIYYRYQKNYIFDTVNITSVTVEARDENGCVDTIVQPVTVFEAHAGFFGDVLTDCIPFTTNFSDTSKSEHTITKRIWNLGDTLITEGNQTSVQIVNTIKANKRVSLIIVDDHGCRDTATYNNYIQPVIPNAQFTVSNPKVCLGHEATFIKNTLSSNYVNDLTHYTWKFGDDTSESNEGNPNTNTTHKYQKATDSTYTVQLIAYCTSPEGNECADSSFQKIDIKDVGAKIKIRDADQCKEPGQKFIVYLDNTIYNSHMQNFKWWKIDGGDSVYISNKNNLQVVTFENYGEQSLYFHSESNYYGCEDTTTFITINVAGYEAEMIAEKEQACVREDIYFYLKDTANLYRYNAYWEFGDGESVPLAESLTSHAYKALAQTENNTYKVQFIVDAEGCKPRDISANITIFPVIADFTRGENDLDTIGCAPYQITLHNTSVAGEGATYLWDFGDGTTSTEKNPTITIDKANLAQPISLSVSSNICNDTIRKNVTTYPYADITIDIDSVLCVGESISAKATGNFNSIQWKPNELFTVPHAPETNANIQKSQYIYITSWSNKNCKNTDSIYVYVQQRPHYYGAPDSVLIYYTSDSTTEYAKTTTNNLIVGQIYNVNATEIEGINYSWSPATYISCTDCSNPDIDLTCGNGTTQDCFDFPEFINYTISMTDSLGCFSEDTTIHFNIILDTKIAMPEAFSPNNDGHNDIAYVRGWGVREFIEVKIYNRWGQVVFESNDMNIGWDGTFKGEPQGMDTYAYTIKAINTKGEEIFTKGYITLIR
ncbi:MAG: PKD domain-containing protein [Bacteroidales bacterium]|nr:PKD domain-containing protein [Bacteroidales bacterium]